MNEEMIVRVAKKFRFVLIELHNKPFQSRV
jgi:hypothetical protein